MISFVRGRVASVSGEVLVLDVGAVGMALHCTAAALRAAHVGAHVEIPVTLVVREDSLTLYGFADSDERTMFDLVQTVSGFGPRVSLAVLSTLGAESLRAAIAREDLKVLTSVPGVGRKGAERLVIELRDKVGGLAAAASRPLPMDAGWQGQVREGLIGLGWSPRDADAAVAVVESDPQSAEAAAAADIATLLRAALRGLDRA